MKAVFKDTPGVNVISDVGCISTYKNSVPEGVCATKAISAIFLTIEEASPGILTVYIILLDPSFSILMASN